MRVITDETTHEAEDVLPRITVDGERVALRLIHWGPMVVATMSRAEAREIASQLYRAYCAEDTPANGFGVAIR